NPARACHSAAAPSRGIDAGGMISTHRADSRASRRARRTTSASTAPAVSAITATTISSGHQACSHRHNMNDRAESHPSVVDEPQRNDPMTPCAFAHAEPDGGGGAGGVATDATSVLKLLYGIGKLLNRAGRLERCCDQY